eukprot:TRINITY_DN1509_c0_g1_i2.p1 TRINITY_DN1509_c0_g1~~TRINITY_DN1509_c0_g1_i2.p1  ORF type:complete len:828 (+),score=146.32 TRINITY_DN1509_c0_g1_i2:96-2579(+)
MTGPTHGLGLLGTVVALIFGSEPAAKSSVSTTVTTTGAPTVMHAAVNVSKQVAQEDSLRPEDLVYLLAGANLRGGAANSDGNTLPQIKRPWGFNDWAPQTQSGSGSWWFESGSTNFEGMRCTHQPSPWIGDYGYFTVTPSLQENFEALSYSPKDSTFRPYLFKSDLQPRSRDGNSRMTMEMAPTSRAAAFRVTFPQNSSLNHRVFLDIGGKGSIQASNNMIKGFSTANSGGVPRDGLKLHFVMKVLDPDLRVKAGTVGGAKAYLSFPGLKKRNVTVMIGTSLISLDQAELNLASEIGSKSFDDVVADGRKEWHESLSRVKVQAQSQEHLRLFYTNLWKAMLFPRFSHEIGKDGKPYHWSPYQGGVHSGKMVTDSGFWDSYHTVYPLLSIVFPDRLGEIMDGWVTAYEEAKWLPTWPSPGQRDSMVATMGDVSLADAIVKSQQGYVSGFNVTQAYEAIRKDAFVNGEGGFGRPGLRKYDQMGFVPIDGDKNAVSETLDFLTADAAIANAAAALRKTEDEKQLRKRLERKGSLFNKATGFFQPKQSNGVFRGFQPLEWGKGFVEASGWQYRFMLPFDVPALSQMYGGNLCKEVQKMFTTTRGTAFYPGSYGQTIHEMRELQATQNDFGLYSHNNQPSHDILWIAKKAGCDEVADKYLRLATEKLYTRNGWAGDEDNGEMGAWYVLASLGLYSLEGGKDELVLGSPGVISASIELRNKKTLQITTENQDAKNFYVHSVHHTYGDTIAHEAARDNVIKFSDLMQGGNLHFQLSQEPKAQSKPVHETQKDEKRFIKLHATSFLETAEKDASALDVAFAGKYLRGLRKSAFGW